MGHYILADDFDFDSIIIKDINFDLNNAVLSLSFTYNDGHVLSSSVDFSEDFATTEYVDNKIIEDLKAYSTTKEVGEMIATALSEYDKSDVVTNKINESIATALSEYYNKTQVDAKDSALKEDYIQRDTNVTNNLTTKINGKSLSGVVANYSTDTNAISVTAKQSDGTQQVGLATIPKVTNSTDGLMSKEQCLKLNGIASNANNYVLPQASATALGGIKASTGDDGYTSEVKIKSDGKLYVTPGQYTLPIANATTLGGVKPTATKTSAYTVPVAVDSEGGLFTIPGNYALPIASASDLGGVKIGYTTSGKNYAVQLDANSKMFVNVPWSDTTYSVATASARGLVKIGYTQSGKNYPVQLSNEQMFVNVPWTDTTYSVVTTSANGLMSASDKVKLNGIATNANNYSLPTMTATIKGGAKLGDGLKVESDTLKVKVDNDTIKIGDNGLYANVQSVPAIDMADLLATYSGTSTMTTYTIEYDGWLCMEHYQISSSATSVSGVFLDNYQIYTSSGTGTLYTTTNYIGPLVKAGSTLLNSNTVYLYGLK